ncbi:MAG: hypothetical protein AABZ32_09970 [Bacteroidota bacterium]
MRPLIVNIPEKEENFFMSLMKKFHFKSRVLTEEDLENEALARWIAKSMQTEDVPMEKVFQLLEKHGSKI